MLVVSFTSILKLHALFCLLENNIFHLKIKKQIIFLLLIIDIRAREIVGFGSSGPTFETENRFISQQGAEK